MFFMYSEENFERANGAKEILFKVPWKDFKWSLSGMPETKESEFNQKLYSGLRRAPSLHFEILNM